MSKTVLITGATSGIGKACAEKYAANGHRIIITGRRAALLEKTQQQLTEKYGIEIHCCQFDVQNRTAVFECLENLPTEWKHIDILINNAGLALGREAFDTANIDDWDTMMHTNVDGLLYVSRAILPLLKKSATPHIVNIGSIAGKEVYENGNVYCASKFSVDAISKSMRIDLLKFGIKVTAIHPGAVNTEFSLVRYKGDQEKADKTYDGLQPLLGEDIAETIFYCTQLPLHVCINELTITPTQQANTYVFHRKH